MPPPVKFSTNLRPEQVVILARRLTARQETLLGIWDRLVGGSWDKQECRALHAALTQLVDDSEQIGSSQIAECAFAAQIYLSSFIDGDLAPNPEQLAKLNTMIDQLRSALPVLPDGVAEDVRAGRTVTTLAAGVARRVIIFCSQDLGVPGLDKALAEHRYAVQSVSELEALLEALDQRQPDALILDAERLPSAERIMREIQALQKAGRPRIPLLTVSRSGDLSIRLRAMRVGVDGHFSPPLSASEILTRLDQLVIADRAKLYRVLIVDDDRSQAFLCDSILRNAGMRTEVVQGAQEAMQVLSKFTPDLILLDLYMPELNGMELTSLIRQREEHVITPILFLSGEKDPEKRFDAIAAGGDDFLTKPVRPRHLVSMVQSRVIRNRVIKSRLASDHQRNPNTGVFPKSHFESTFKAQNRVDRHESLGIFYVAPRHRGEPALERHIADGFMRLVSAQFNSADIPTEFPDSACVVWALRATQRDLEALAKRIASTLASHEFDPADSPSTPRFLVGLYFVEAGDRLEHAAACAMEAAEHNADTEPGTFCLWQNLSCAADSEQVLSALVTALTSTPHQLVAQPLFTPLVPVHDRQVDQYLMHVNLFCPGENRIPVGYEGLRGTAEEAGAAAGLDRICLQAALSARHRQFERGRQVRVLVPQSCVTLLETDLCMWLTEALRALKLSGTGITLEYPYAQVVGRMDTTRAAIEDLSRLGVRCCLSGTVDEMNISKILLLAPDFVRINELERTTQALSTVQALATGLQACACAVIYPGSRNGAALEIIRSGVRYLCDSTVRLPDPDYRSVS